MLTTLDTLAGLGVDWVAIHPYASIRGDGALSWPEITPGNPPRWLARPIEEAHRRGLRILLKPHLAYWGSPFSWRGEIRFEQASAQQRFFDDYRRWMDALLPAVAGADALVLGTELEGTTQHEAKWRRLVEVARGHYRGPLTYAANWSTVAEVPFWDALDLVGIQAYYPVLAEGVAPTEAALKSGWKKVISRMKSISDQHHKPVLLTELGYNRSSRAPYEPWAYAQGGPDAAAVQARVLDVALASIATAPWIRGAFLWKWFPGDRPVGNFAMADPAIRDVIARRWRAAGQ
jgi:hypothetical protein